MYLASRLRLGKCQARISFQRRGYPDILTSEERLEILTTVRKRIRADPALWINPAELPKTRQAWLRRVNTITGLTVATITLSATVVVPFLNEALMLDLPYPITVGLGAIAVMTGSEITKLVADQGLKVSLPVFLSFASLMGFPMCATFAAFPGLGAKAIALSFLSLVTALTVAYNAPTYTSKFPIMMGILLGIPFLAGLVPPFGATIPETICLLAGGPLFTYGTWRVCQRNFKLAKYSPHIEDLDERITNTVGLLLGFPVLLVAYLLACGEILNYLFEGETPQIENIKV